MTTRAFRFLGSISLVGGLWQTIARRYKDEPTVAGYDLLNEPLPEQTGAVKTFKAQLGPLYKHSTKAIREMNPKHG